MIVQHLQSGGYLVEDPAYTAAYTHEGKRIADHPRAPLFLEPEVVAVAKHVGCICDLRLTAKVKLENI